MELLSLSDYLGEEVVDRDGVPVGTLRCYWESAPDVPEFCGIELKCHSVVRVVPVQFSRNDERHSCVRLNVSAQKVETAPGWDCSIELDGPLQQKVNAHFGLIRVASHSGLKHFAREPGKSRTGKDSLRKTTRKGRRG